MYLHVSLLYLSRCHISSAQAYLDSQQFFYSLRAVEKSSIYHALASTTRIFAVCVVHVQLRMQV